MHPHRGFDIFTYVLDGSDGFRHRDSLGGSKTYRGGQCQWMRTGSGVLHEEFWETSPDRRTNIELYQLWVNLPAERKFDPPMVKYLGQNTDDPWIETEVMDPDSTTQQRKVATVRDLGATLDRAVESDVDEAHYRRRPPVDMRHVTIEPGSEWTVQVPREHSAMLYVREGIASLPSNTNTNANNSGGGGGSEIILAKAQEVATFAPDGDSIVIRNAQKGKGQTLDLLLLMAMPLREPVAQAGPIVMNSNAELKDAYQQLSDGTFLDRDEALRQQAKIVESRARFGSSHTYGDAA
jgi:redox-sensitive bicupin YhaK (pirin superfamily)